MARGGRARVAATAASAQSMPGEISQGRRTANAPRSRLHPRSPSNAYRVQGSVDVGKQEVPVGRLSQGRVILDRP